MELNKETIINKLSDAEKAEILNKFTNLNALSNEGVEMVKKHENKDEFFYIKTSRAMCNSESQYSAEFYFTTEHPKVWIPLKDIYGLDNKVSLILSIRIYKNKVYYVDKNTSIIGGELIKYASTK